ncbi:hypothetical protein B0H10DRAFT_1948189 [Mycena sp. CBHHK59/15]|nr:hypothetical protein B0H10DRAFT_1948189 [Mycena sp. CBHHK59/15]
MPALAAPPNNPSPSSYTPAPPTLTPAKRKYHETTFTLPVPKSGTESVSSNQEKFMQPYKYRARAFTWGPACPAHFLQVLRHIWITPSSSIGGLIKGVPATCNARSHDGRFDYEKFFDNIVELFEADPSDPWAIETLERYKKKSLAQLPQRRNPVTWPQNLVNLYKHYHQCLPMLPFAQPSCIILFLYIAVLLRATEPEPIDGHARAKRAWPQEVSALLVMEEIAGQRQQIPDLARSCSTWRDRLPADVDSQDDKMDNIGNQPANEFHDGLILFVFRQLDNQFADICGKAPRCGE